MNTQNINLFKEIRKDEKEKMSTQVNETVAVSHQHEKSFTAADLWNIQRNKRNFQPRRYFTN
jgi:hypothetical protein